MIIRVTANHIARGLRNDCLACPVALAMQDAGLPEGELDNALNRFSNSGVPQSAYEFFENFDRGLDVQPFEFEYQPLAARGLR